MTEEEKKRAIEKLKVEHERVKNAVETVSGTVPGKVLLRYLNYICGFDKSSLVIHPQTGEINAVATAYNESRRSVYLQLRSMIPIAVLKEIEYPTEEK